VVKRFILHSFPCTVSVFFSWKPDAPPVFSLKTVPFVLWWQSRGRKHIHVRINETNGFLPRVSETVFFGPTWQISIYGSRPRILLFKTDRWRFQVYRLKLLIARRTMMPLKSIINSRQAISDSCAELSLTFFHKSLARGQSHRRVSAWRRISQRKRHKRRRALSSFRILFPGWLRNKNQEPEPELWYSTIMV